jgi:hypothetical protein
VGSLWGRSGSLWIVVGRCGSLWIVVGHCGVVVGRCGSLWVVVGRCGSFHVLVTTANTCIVQKQYNQHVVHPVP